MGDGDQGPEVAAGQVGVGEESGHERFDQSQVGDPIGFHRLEDGRGIEPLLQDHPAAAEEGLIDEHLSHVRRAAARRETSSA